MGDIVDAAVKATGGWAGHGVKQGTVRALLEADRVQSWRSAVGTTTQARWKRSPADLKELVRGRIVAALTDDNEEQAS